MEERKQRKEIQTSHGLVLIRANELKAEDMTVVILAAIELSDRDTDITTFLLHLL